MGIAPPISLYCTGVYSVEERGHSPPPPIVFDWNCVLSLLVAGHPEESIAFLRLMVVASIRLLLVPEGVGIMPVISMLSPRSTECL